MVRLALIALPILVVLGIFLIGRVQEGPYSYCPSTIELMKDDPITAGGVGILSYDPTIAFAAEHIDTTDVYRMAYQFNFNLMSREHERPLEKVIKTWLLYLEAPWIELGIVDVLEPYQDPKIFRNRRGIWNEPGWFSEGNGRYRISRSENSHLCLPDRGWRGRENQVFNNSICVDVEWLGPPALAAEEAAVKIDDRFKSSVITQEGFIEQSEWLSPYVFVQSSFGSSSAAKPIKGKKKPSGQRYHREVRSVLDHEVLFRQSFQRFEFPKKGFGGYYLDFEECGPGRDISKLKLFADQR